MPDTTQQSEWLEWEREVNAAIAVLRADGGHPRVVQLLEHQVTVALHNAYCEQPIAFPRSGVPIG
jgi:hypothetical protein